MASRNATTRCEIPGPGGTGPRDARAQLVGRRRGDPGSTHAGPGPRGLCPAGCHVILEADVPVLQISFRRWSRSDSSEVGRRLAPLRNEGVLIIGSGFLIHNLSALRATSVPGWAKEFDAWTAERRCRVRDPQELLSYRMRAPGVVSWRCPPTSTSFRSSWPKAPRWTSRSTSPSPGSPGGR